VVADIRHVQDQIAREGVLNRKRPGFHIRCTQMRIHGNDRTTTAGSAGGGRRVPDQNSGAAIMNRRCGIHASTSSAVPLYGSERSFRPAPTHLTNVTRTA
jgi:hypothetical protein